jgi:hypothetical protein
MKRLLGLPLAIVLLVFGCSDPFSDFDDFGRRFLQALQEGDGMTVRSLCVESEAQRIWDAVQARQLDKARRIWLRQLRRGASDDSFIMWVADMPDTSSIQIRLEVVIDGSRGWRGKSIKFD